MNQSDSMSITLTAPTFGGTYYYGYYGACVDAVAVSITVVGPLPPGIYWTDYYTAKIQRANLDGSNVFVTQGLVSPSSIGQTGQNAADVNGDEFVNILDLIAVAGALDTGAAANVRQWLFQV